MRRKEEKPKMKNHTEFRDTIDKRTEDLSGNWWPFVQNINDILDRMDEIEAKIDSYDNRVGEAYGLGRTIAKSLNKLGFYDDDLHLKWKAVTLINEVLEDAENERKEKRRSDNE